MTYPWFLCTRKISLVVFDGTIFSDCVSSFLHSRYSTPVDIWSVGCIFAEMHLGRPLFPGQNTQDQLNRIFRLFGTPDEHSFASVGELPDWNPERFGSYPAPESLERIFPELPVDGVHLMEQMLRYDPARRITARAALDHPFFADLPHALRTGGIMGPRVTTALTATEEGAADSSRGEAAAPAGGRHQERNGGPA